MYPPADAVEGWVDRECTEHLDSYVRLIEDARREGLPVRLGLEGDYLPGYEAELERIVRGYPWDYVIGSVHWIPPARRGEPWWGFDNLARAEETWRGRDVLDAYRQYFRLITQAAATGLFDFIGHADLIKVGGHRPGADVTDLYEGTARAFARAGVCAEINTAGWRKPVGEMYPDGPLLRALFRAQVPTLINSDAHVPEDVARDFDRAAAAAREAGYAEVATFAARSRTMAPLVSTA